MRTRLLALIWILLAVALPAAAQSPNTGSLIVVVVDQSGGVVKDAKVTVTNTATSAVRDAVSGAEGSATIAALPLTGEYKVSVAKQGFTADEVTGLTLRAGEIATVRVKLVASGGKSEVTVYGTTSGTRADAQIGTRLPSAVIDETPILGRKITSLPLLSASFRSAKGTGDLFVNATYFVTGAGGRRQTTVTLDGMNNDEGWGRQTAIATVPIGAVQEMQVLSNAFSSEFGWTSGPALNIVTKAGTNALHGEGLYMNRPGSWQSEDFSTDGFCPSSVASCVTPTTLAHVLPIDIPDKLNQYSGTIGGAFKADKTFYFGTIDHTRQDRTTFLSPTLPSFVLPADGNLEWTGHYRQTLFNGRVDHKLTPSQTIMVRVNTDTFFDDNPQDAVGGTNAPSVARKYSRSSWTLQANHTMVLGPTMLNEARIAYLNGDPVTKWEAGELSTTYVRGGSVPFTIGQSRLSDLFGHQFQFADTLSWTRGNHFVRSGTSIVHHTSGGTGNEPGQAMLGTFNFLNSTTAPFDQLTLADVQNYQQPISFGITSYELSQWLLAFFVQDSFRVNSDLTIDAGLRYDIQTLTDARGNVAPRLGFGWHPRGDARTSVRGGYGMYYTQVRSNSVAGALTGGLDGFVTYTATPGQFGFPTCLNAPCVPVNFDPATLPPSQLPARDITIRAGRAAEYREQFARYGLNFDALPNYPNELVNPRSQVMTIGMEREVKPRVFVGADYVHQHWTDLDRTVDLNAPSAFDRTAAGQTRTVAQANATRPILPVNGGVRQVNVLTNLGVADYDGLQTQVSFRGFPKWNLSIGYTLSKATNTSEPDGNGIGPNQSSANRLGEEERGPSVLDQRHRAVISFSYLLPYNITAGTVTMLASARPFNATTGVDNNGDGANNDRPVVDGQLMSKSDFRGTGLQDVSMFVEGRIKKNGRAVLLRLEGFNLFNHGNYLGRGITTWGNGNEAASTFGQLVSAGTLDKVSPAFANVDPPRMFQIQIRYLF